MWTAKLLDKAKTQLPLSLTTETLWAGTALFSSRLFIGVVPILIKICEREIDPNTTVFYRLWSATVFLGVWNGLLAVRNQLSNEQSEKKESYTTEVLGLLLLSGIFVSAFQIIWAWSVTQTSIANSSLMHGLIPPFTVLVGWLFLGHRFDNRFLVAMTVAIVGMMIIGITDLQFSFDKVQGDIVALLSALFTALYLLSVERLRNNLSSTTILMWSCAIGTVLTLPILVIVKDEFFPSSWDVKLAAIGLGLTLALGQGLVVYSLKKFSSGFVSMICLLDPILSTTLAWSIFSETLSLYNLVGFAVVLLGLYLITYSQSVVKE
ncbi:MAG: DMT family transporter [Scytonema sp. PMC 1069.18]|nr:DMT family transporter [Scytonema sp. PMC 1069.18]MEC4879901.1 DMT family transporter [Scytonema sp. PMC 1070.18]